ncbi:hypothetical protein PIB30_055014 [Stylosanthes scabra]|uniref:KIB1-4 beta-propeller domain-containing protein n=1 Tax=Stylosanthes scabra TaxID=79078 RepID=A0ABU6QIJ9_9FABA|nr:hypothetical protein [Stylosanthes scabra]
MAVIIYGYGCNLAYYKPNDDKRWLEFPTRKSNFHDVIFFGKRIYAIDDHGQLYEFDTNTESGSVGGIHEAKPPSNTLFGSYKLKYVVGCDNGSLLMLVRYVTFALHTYKFDIFELKKNAKEWSRLYSLETYILIIGLNSSVQILPASIQSKGNQIYFTEGYIELRPSDYAVTHDIGIFNLDDGSCQRLLSDATFCTALFAVGLGE